MLHRIDTGRNRLLDIRTFDAVSGGSTLYKALAHPRRPAAITVPYARLTGVGGAVAFFDPGGVAEPLAMLHPMEGLPVSGVYVQDVRQIGTMQLGRRAQPVTELRQSGAKAVLFAAYDAKRALVQL